MTKIPSDSSDKNSRLTADELLESARELKRQTQAIANKRGEKPRNKISETLHSVDENLSYFRKLLYTCKETYLGLMDRFGKPLVSLLGPLLRWLFSTYRRFWNRYSYYTDRATGERVFSRKRSSLVIGLSIAVASIFTPTALGDAVRFATTEPVFDAFLMSISKKTELFYLNNSQEIDPEANEHAVRGCRTMGQCTENDAIYFRVKPRLSHDIWKLIVYGNPIYVPDHVIAPIAPGVNRCEVTYYGYRMTSSWISRLLRSFQVYPTMLETNCTAVTADIIEGQQKGIAPVDSSTDK